MTRTIKFAIPLLAAGLLTACSGSEESAALNVTNEEVGTLEPVNATETPVVNLSDAPVSNATVTTAPPVEIGAPDSTTYDDADATGLTARVDRGNETAPAE